MYIFLKKVRNWLFYTRRIKVNEKFSTKVRKRMNKQQVIENALLYIRELFQGESSGHDYFHSERVYRNAMAIAEKEGGDQFIIALAAILHDVDDRKLFGTHETLEHARTFMREQNVEDAFAEQICDIIKNMSFGSGKVPASIEGKIVQDADRLDAIGAIGIARTFAFGGHKGRVMYDPDEKPAENLTPEEYKNHVSTTVNHFYEKLFKLRELMNTDGAKEMAEHRHQFMSQFLEEFYGEWNGRK